MVRPASLSTLVRRSLEGECALPGGTTVLVAVSGGPDSMALLSTLARLAPRFGLSVLAHGVDHGLRDAAAAELDIAESFARSAGLRFDRTRIAVPRGGNLQARARQLRWRALVDAARQHEGVIATAHQADDRAETLVMRILRGAGLRGLGVLPARATAPEARDVTVVRPLLRARRPEILAHLQRNKVPFARDPSNEDPRYLRTRVRTRVMPLLEELDPAVVRHLGDLADELVVLQPVRSGDGHLPEGPLAWTAGLPRPTQEALRTLLLEPSSTARVWLPGGLVVSVDPRAQRSQRPVQRTRE